MAQIWLWSALMAASAAHALNLNETAVKGIARAYGFVYGQEQSLRRIAREFPELELQAEIARRQFSATFPSVLNRLQAELEKAAGASGFKELQVKVLADVAAMLDRQQLTRVLAADFIELVKRRAKGEIESPVLEYLLTVTYAQNPAGEFANGFRQRYETDGSGKAQGVRLQLQLPRSWRAEDGLRPHIVTKWTSQNGSGLESIHIDVRDAEGYTPTRKEIENLVRSGEVKDFVPEGAAYRSSGVFSVEARPGYWLEMTMRQERAGISYYQGVLMYQFFFRGKAVGLMCMAGGPEKDSASIDESYQRIKPLCQQVLNSVVLPQAY